MSRFSEDINSEIFSRLPVKSVLRARGSSKGIRDLIDDPNFVGKHLKFSSQRNPSLLLTDNRCRAEGNNLNTLYFVQNEETPNHYSCNKVSFQIPGFQEFRVMGSCNGLICLVHPDRRYEIYVCNPCTGKYNKIPPPVSRDDRPHFIFVGFGVIPETNKYKVVAVVDSPEHGDFNRLLQRVYVYTLGDTTWKQLKDNSPVLRLRQSACKPFVNGALHWVCDDKHIVSFTMDTEDFGFVPPPELELGSGSFSLRAFIGKLMILNRSFGDRIEMWVMNNYGDVGSWTRNFTISQQHIGRDIRNVEIVCFLEDGEVLMACDHQVLLRYNLEKALADEVIRIDGLPERFDAFAHVGTLVSPVPRIEEQIKLDKMDLDRS
ncbi:hypothetical protein Vadar_025435 [Vaccinium darrowii]|uniref:Uncharacterized protein n=1 Tax=Vaccinium darrowii TaxID=229202 RepID=A0ACB7Z684_9ERIC|nr:hypothetical protein Vadar_025435 [Vaccinium darrowii]